MEVTLRAVREDRPGPRWKALFDEFWPAYQAWFLKEGEFARPTYHDAVAALRQHMPELMPLYEELVELAGGSDRVARCLSLYRPTPYLTGCSQVVWTGEVPALIRNYDYSPSLWEAVVLSSKWGRRRVIAMTDCLWGALDGINDAGLVVSLSFGGAKRVGDGFGCPLLLRYLLEECRTAAEASAILRRVPIHMAYNITALDAKGDFVTGYLSPGRDPVLRRWPIATNHQEKVEWKEYARATSSQAREQFLAERLGDPQETSDALAGRFLEPPLFNERYDRALGTLYTAVYSPVRKEVEYRWRGRSMRQSLRTFREGELTLEFGV